MEDPYDVYTAPSDEWIKYNCIIKDGKYVYKNKYLVQFM